MPQSRLHHSLSWLVGTHDTGDNPAVRVIVLTLLFFVLYGILAPCSTLGPPVDGVAARASVPANND